ncbi:MAG: FtsX-like permease family protein [Acidobacteriota bacterium]
MLKKAFRILGLLKGWTSLWRRPNEEQAGDEIDEELAFHLERRSQDWMASGLTPAQARQQACQEFGDLEATRNYCRQISRRRNRSRQRENFEQLVERAERLPGVERACIASQHPLRAGWSAFFGIEGKPPMAPGQQRSAVLRPVGPGYFEMLGIALQRGRSLTAQDDSRAVGAAIVNQAFVRRFLPAQDPLQQRLKMSHWWGARGPEYQVVGVVSDVRFAGLDAPAAPAIYLPHAQWPVSEASLLVKTHGDPLSLAPSIRTEVAALDPTLPVDGVTSLELELGDSLRQHRFTLLLLGSFASTALLLASLGVYGLLSFLVSRRSAEIGLRLALGADRQDVLISALGQALRLVAPGLAIGLVLALGLSRTLAGLLYGVSPLDPATYAGVVFVLLLSALLASFLPALRATRVDPIQVLRSE